MADFSSKRSSLLAYYLHVELSHIPWWHGSFGAWSIGANRVGSEGRVDEETSGFSLLRLLSDIQLYGCLLGAQPKWCLACPHKGNLAVTEISYSLGKIWKKPSLLEMDFIKTFNSKKNSRRVQLRLEKFRITAACPTAGIYSRNFKKWNFEI